MSAEGAARHDPLRATLLASAALGAAIGLSFPTQHVAIEPAQVLAGLVHYAFDNPFGLYERRVWTLLHQVLAPLLAAGIGEVALSFAMSAFIGAFGFAAVATFARACGAPTLLAVIAPALLWLSNPLRWGFNYPIFLLGTPHTYGMTGLAWVLLAIALLGAGRVRAGAFLLGLAPAVHPSLGLWIGSLAAACLLADLRGARALLPELIRGGAAGVAVAAVSLAVHILGQGPGPEPAASEVTAHMNAFMRDWDGHRGEVVLVGWNGMLLGIGILLALQQLMLCESAARSLMLRIYVGSALLGIVFVILHRDAPIGAIPAPILAAMPARVLNLPMIAFLPLLIAALAAQRHRPIARFALLAIVVMGLVRHRAEWAVTWGLPALGFLAITLAARPDSAPSEKSDSAAAPWFENMLRIAAGIALALAIGATLRVAPIRAARFIAHASDPVLLAARGGSGTLLVAPGLPYVQLSTRRPLLLDPNSIDMLPYAPAGGPEVARIVREVYGIDFFRPPRSARNLAAVDPVRSRAVWERRSSARWAALGDGFGFDEVLAPPEWRIALPELARSDYAVLYAVP